MRFSSTSSRKRRFRRRPTVAAQDVDGTIRVRNFLHGDPSIRVALSEDLVIDESALGGGGGGAGGDYATCFLDDANFHECADTTSFDAERVLRVDVVPRGEFALMNYRSSSDFSPPFLVETRFDESTPYQVVATITIKATYDNSLACAGLAITFPTPKSKSVVAATTAIETRAPAGSQHAAHGAADARCCGS